MRAVQSTLLNRPAASSAKPGRSDIEEKLSNDSNATTATTTTTSYSKVSHVAKP